MWLSRIDRGVARLTTVVLLVVVCTIPGLAEAPPPQAWSETELRRLESLRIGRLEKPMFDPSNRVANDPKAALLGHRLFFDPAFSGNGEIACSHCHRPELFFTDGLPRSEGIGTTRRGALTVIGTVYSPWFYWDGRRDSQWAQALVPFEAPVEMNSTRTTVARRVADDPDYRKSYEVLFGPLPDATALRALPERAGPLGSTEEQRAWEAMTESDRRTVNRVFANVGKSLAAYQRKLIPGPSRFDRYLEGVLGKTSESTSLSSAELEGLRLFVSGEMQCMRCHNGPLFTNQGFHNVGSSPVDQLPPDTGRLAGVQEALRDEFNCRGSYSDAREGQCRELDFVRVEGEELSGAFKVPTLRNVAETAPYMHDGRFSTLAEVLDHYRKPTPGLGHLELAPMNITDEQREQLAAFLGTLTSPVVEERWSLPPQLAPPPRP